MEWPYDNYPEYCLGVTYMMSPKVMEKLLSSFKKTMKENYIWMEDIYITGILPKLSNIQLLTIRPLVYKKLEKSTKNPKFMLAHCENLTPVELVSIYQDLFGKI